MSIEKSVRQPVAPQAADTVAELETRIRKLETVVATLHQESIQARVFNAAYQGSMLWWHDHYNNLPRKKDALNTCVEDSLTVAMAAVEALNKSLASQKSEK